MSPWTSPRTWLAGEAPTAATLNTHIRDNLLFLSDPPAVYIWMTAATLSHTTSGTWQDVTGYTEDSDTDTMWTSANSYVNINTTGRYLLTGSVRFANNSTGLRGVRVLLSTDGGGTYPTFVANSLVGTGSGANDCSALTSIEVDLAAGDRIKLQGNQYSTAALNIVGSDRAYTYLSARLVAP